MTCCRSLQILQQIQAGKLRARDAGIQRFVLLLREVGNVILSRPTFQPHRTPGFLTAYLRTVELVTGCDTVKDDATALRTLEKVRQAEALLRSVE